MKYVSTAVREPSRIAPFVKDFVRSKIKQANHWRIRKRQRTPRQKPMLHKFTDQDEFLLVILDATRYDIFTDHYQESLNGELSKVWASGRWTGQYAERTWDGDHDFTYLSTVPVINDRRYEQRGRDYRPTKHLHNLVNVWETHWDPELETVRADTLTRLALEKYQSGTRRMAVHYLQPHAPYIGRRQAARDEGATSGLEDKELDSQRIFENRSKPTEVLLEQIESGELSDAELKEAYRENLKYVLRHVEKLIQRVNVPVVVTSDHGEHLGEGSKYLHQEDSALIRQVPWLEVSPELVGSRLGEPLDYDANQKLNDGANRDIKEQLKSLGYTS